MATTPAKSASPNTQVNIHGIPPKPHMADETPPVDEKTLSDSTRTELEAGRKAVSLSSERKNAEFEAGKKAIAHLQHVKAKKE